MAVVTGCPWICSGLAYSGVSTDSPVCVGPPAASAPAEPGSISLAIPKFDQLGYAVAGDQDVARLQVPVDHRVLVGELDRAQDLIEEQEPRAHVEPPAVAILVDPLSVDVLHDEIWPSVRGSASVQEPGDIGMLTKRSLDVDLGTEPAHDRLAVHAPVDQLDSNALLEILDPRRQVDASHAVGADPCDELVGTKPLADHRIGVAVSLRLADDCAAAIMRLRRVRLARGQCRCRDCLERDCVHEIAVRRDRRAIVFRGRIDRVRIHQTLVTIILSEHLSG